MQTKVRIVAMGDSTTAGTPGFASPIEAPPNGRGNEESQYAYWLIKTHPDWEVLNRGVNGERTDQIAARFERDVIAARPSVVVLIAGVNDIYQGRSVDDVTRRLREMYDRASRAGIRVIAGTIIPFNTATPDQNERMRRVNAWIREQAERDPSLGFVDARAAVAAPGNPDALASSPDQLHPSAEGYRMMADAIGPAVAAALKR
ncbi:MAG TPA: GDSL-type esterase/lipase family protein [Vicinamibacterales bacterium]